MTNTMKESDSLVENFAKCFEKKSNEIHIDQENLRKLSGRVTRGSKESDFEYLDKDATAKKFAWVMGDDGLMMFLKNANLDALRAIGFEDRWIRKRLESGECFRLGVFYRSDKCVPGTWDGIFSLIKSHYPKNIYDKVMKHAEELKRISFDEIEARARLTYLNGVSYFEVDELAVNGYSTDPRFMSDERFFECEGTLEQTRGFLYHRLGLSRLFDGNGFTKDSFGRLFVKEFLQPNIPVRDMAAFRYLDVPIDIDELEPDA